MSVFQSQYTRALKVIPSDNANIPYPNLIISGTSTSVAASSLIDSKTDFIALNIAAGDIIYNTSDNTAATVVKVVNETTLLLNANIFTSTAQEYYVYNSSSQTSNGNPGCYLYIGVNGVEVTVTTIGGDIVQFRGLSRGTVLPVQVIKVHSSGTDATEIIALW